MANTAVSKTAPDAKSLTIFILGLISGDTTSASFSIDELKISAIKTKIITPIIATHSNEDIFSQKEIAKAKIAANKCILALCSV